MMNFTEWDNKDEPQGLEGVKRRILSEAPRRKAAPMKVFKDPNAVDPKIAAQAKAREEDAAKRVAIAKDRAAGNVEDAFQDNAPLAARATRAVTGKEPKKPGSLDLGKGGSGTKPPTKPPVASAPEPEDETGGKLDSLLKDIKSEHDPFTSSPEDNLDEIRDSLKGKSKDMYDKLLEIYDMEDDAISIMESQDPKLLKNRDILKKLVGSASQKKGFDAKKTYARLMALGQTYEGRNRRGQGARSLGYEQVQQLTSNRENLIKEFGDGSPEAIKQMVQNRLISDTPMEVVEEFYKSLPPKARAIFSKGGAINGPAPFLDKLKKMVSRDFKGQHYQGVDDEGNEIRGGTSGRGRQMLTLKRLMDQGFMDPYTGLPLDLDRIELDHVRAVQDPDDGEDAPNEDSFLKREHPDNWLFADAGVNSMKNNMNMKRFFESIVDPMKDKDRSEYADVGNIQEMGNQHASQVQNLIKSMLLDENGLFRQDLDPGAIDNVIGQEGSLIEALKQGGVKQKSRFAKELFSAFRGGGRGKKIVRQQTGIKNQLSTPEWTYLPFIRALSQMSPEDQSSAADSWNTASLDTQKALMAHLRGEEDDPNVVLGKDGTPNVNASYQGGFLKRLKAAGIDFSDGLSPKEQKKLLKMLGEETLFVLDPQLIAEADLC